MRTEIQRLSGAGIASIEVFIAQKQQMEQRCTRAIIRALMVFLAHLIGTALTGKGGMTMPDREKVIKEFEHLLNAAKGNYQDFVDLTVDGGEEILALLKEQEPIEPVDDGHGSLICGNQGYECGCVGRYDLTTKVVEKYCNFCPECGRQVKWE